MLVDRVVVVQYLLSGFGDDKGTELVVFCVSEVVGNNIVVVFRSSVGFAGVYVCFNVRFQNLTIRKTKAHRSLQQATVGGDPEDRAGNDWADRLAKQAASYGTPMNLRKKWKRRFFDEYRSTASS